MPTVFTVCAIYPSLAFNSWNAFREARSRHDAYDAVPRLLLVHLCLLLDNDLRS